MSTLVDPWPRPHLFNVDEYHRMAEVGLLSVYDRVQLIEGQVLDMPPISSFRAGVVTYLNHYLIRALIDRAILSPHNPVRLDRFSEPEPAIAILKPRTDFYRKSHPTVADVHLLIEVSDTTLNFDLGRKSALYARHGVPELWVVDLVNKQLYCRREPLGESYQRTTMLQVSQSISMLAFPEITLQVAALFG